MAAIVKPQWSKYPKPKTNHNNGSSNPKVIKAKVPKKNPKTIA
jgi:hypothetical protein